MIRRLGSLLAFGILLGCAEPEAGPEEGAPEAFAGEAESVFRGHFVWGHEVRSFVECGSDLELWVLDRTGGELKRAHEAEVEVPYGRLYAEMLGRRGPAPTDGFGADYDGLLTVTELVRTEPARSGC